MNVHDTPFVDRRVLLALAGATAAGFAALSIGSLITDAGASREWESTLLDTAGEPDRALARAWERAQTRHVPLVVLLDVRREEGDGTYAWAAYLDLASDAAHAHLALCELVFASAEQVRRVCPEPDWRDALDRGGELTSALVVHTDPPAVVRVEPVWMELTVWNFLDVEPTPEVLQWVRETEARLNRAIAPDTSTFERSARAALGQPTAARATLEATLAAASRERLARLALPGAKWVKPGRECGELEFEDGTHDGVAITCGAAVCTPRSRHFLWLYTNDRR